MKMLLGMLDKNEMTIIDVRDEWEYEEGHYPGAINIPLRSIPLHLSALRDMVKPLVVYCTWGNRSKTATIMLRTAGIEEAFDGGGFQELLALKPIDQINKTA